MADLVVRGGTVWSIDGVGRADVVITDGLIEAIEPDAPGAPVEIDAAGLHVLPGAIDAHVHLNDPGRAEWEGFDAGTAALAAGGTTCLADMPLNAVPATVDAEALAAKLDAAAGVARIDFALWGGLVPGDRDRLDELAAGGVCGFKAFLAPSGVAEFEAADDLTLYEGMVRAAALGLPVAVHAESASITSGLAARAAAAGRVGMVDYLASRPVVAELEAVERALVLAGEAGCHVHLCHLSTARAVALVLEARARGVRATCETCPHYLLLTADDAVRIGALAKCAPPLRPAAERDALVAAVRRGDVDLVGSDHSPSPAALKEDDDLFAVWGGIAGAQTLLRGLLTAGIEVDALPTLLGRAPAALLGIGHRKGALAPGLDADLVLVDATVSAPFTVAELLSRHRLSPLVGRRLVGAVRGVLVRGTDALGAPPNGRFVPRSR
jgi:allantoinase